MAVIKKEEPKTKMIDMGYKYGEEQLCKVEDVPAIHYPPFYIDDAPKEIYSKLKIGESFSFMVKGNVTSMSLRENENKETRRCELEIHSMSIPE